MRTPEYKEDLGIPHRVPRWRDAPFISITDAYLQLELIFNYTTDIILTPGPDASFWDEVHIGLMSWQVGRLRRQLDKWEFHFKELILPQAGRDTIALKLLELRLKLLRLIMRAKDFGTPNELCWDSFTSEFLILVEDAKNILVMRYNALSNGKTAPQRQQTATFTITPMMKDALYIITRICRDSRVRRRIAALSDHDYYLSPDIDTPIYIAMARAIIEVEETGWGLASRLERLELSCACDEAAQFICDGHRVRCTCLEAATGSHATLWVKTVYDVYNDRAWARIQIQYGSYKPALVPLAEI
ncbi:hypothetical protein NLG97_g1115 [Lecanicillium saksenae]|uniref:Uncharacterized protein n=1 Tax=Lecanicillium saksenae TaxID=468837 RepID=A0ACC1R601_9HYPO|nr:hypothetical protein NLG97_g1115 [Lecanicillium saksenae]